MTLSPFRNIPNPMSKKLTRPVWAWALYDWGNSAFVTTVVAAFFPIFFKKYWSQGIDPTVSTFYLGTAMSVAALVFACAAPILGTFADFYGWKKKGVIVFAVFGSLLTCCFFLVDGGQWVAALCLYGLAWIGFTGANLFYDSLLVEVTEQKHFNFVSGFGYGLGYLGGGVLIVINAMMVTKPEMFGLADAVAGVKWAFLTVGLWWLIFTIPLIMWVPEGKADTKKHSWLEGFSQVRKTVTEVLQQKNLLLFLIAFFFYIDGVHTIYKMAVDFAMAINLESKDLITAIVIVQFVGFPATIVYAYIADKVGTKASVLAGLVVYSLLCIGGAFMTTSTHFFILAMGLGLVQGGVQALSGKANSDHGRLSIRCYSPSGHHRSC